MKRLEKESFEDYKERRKLTQKTIKQKLHGRWFWRSKFVIPFHEVLNKKYVKPIGSASNGTYVAKKESEKTSFTKDLRNEKGYSEFLKNKKLAI